MISQSSSLITRTMIEDGEWAARHIEQSLARMRGEPWDEQDFDERLQAALDRADENARVRAARFKEGDDDQTDDQPA
jgi:hypothetical protein